MANCETFAKLICMIINLKNFTQTTLSGSREVMVQGRLKLSFKCASYFFMFVSLMACAHFEGPSRSASYKQSYSPTLTPPKGIKETNSPRLAKDLDWPVDRAHLTRGFFIDRKGDQHWGVDLAANRGTEIFAAGDGQVIYVGKGFSGYGRLVIIEHDGKFATFYSHLQNFRVQEGDKVVRGDVIGTMGDSGNARGVHLHFELRQDKRPVDPEAFLPKT